MPALTERVKEIFEKQQTVVFATADKNGIPNVVPVSAVKLLDDETVLISDQFFKKTLSNLKENPNVAISFWEEIEGYQIKGEAGILTGGKLFEETAVWIKKMGEELGFPLKSKGAVVIKIKEIYSVTPGPDAGKMLN